MENKQIKVAAVAAAEVEAKTNGVEINTQINYRGKNNMEKILVYKVIESNGDVCEYEQEMTIAYCRTEQLAEEMINTLDHMTFKLLQLGKIPPMTNWNGETILIPTTFEEFLNSGYHIPRHVEEEEIEILDNIPSEEEMKTNFNHQLYTF